MSDTAIRVHGSCWSRTLPDRPKGVSARRGFCCFLRRSTVSWVGLHCTAFPVSRQQSCIVGRNIHGKAATRALFTGIVEEMGTVASVGPVDDGFEMTINASVALDGVKLGDSIAVNGTCLTVTRFDQSSFSVGLAPETLRRTSLGEVTPGFYVNLERSLQPTSRMGGHFVQGHVDGTGTIVSLNKEGDSLWVKVRTSVDVLRYIVPKGYIAVDGTSLTIVDVFDDELAFSFMLVAYTQQKIVIPLKAVGSKVNLEVDIVGKYVERLLAGYSTTTGEIGQS
ncbi:hypothetical protein GOP47_0013949 [Adiantum capillus-veneris]|uniref:Riboflavin synthase n=1 Tax=Adiantum capillus-veneris TaxID=13818 RepID=A0A9D4UPH7_ADICA|nr:hypothetical protein GOP47_0013949 [Adiantum capillus-veneris]